MSDIDLRVALMESGRMNLMHLPPGAISWLWDRPTKQIDAAESLAVAANAHGNPVVDASLLKADQNVLLIKCEGGECFRIYPDGGFSHNDSPMDIGGCSSVLQGMQQGECPMDDNGHQMDDMMQSVVGSPEFATPDSMGGMPMVMGESATKTILEVNTGEDVRKMMRGEKPFIMPDENQDEEGVLDILWNLTHAGRLSHTVGIGSDGKKVDWFTIKGEEWRADKASEIHQITYPSTGDKARLHLLQNFRPHEVEERRARMSNNSNPTDESIGNDEHMDAEPPESGIASPAPLTNLAGEPTMDEAEGGINGITMGGGMGTGTPYVGDISMDADPEMENLMMSRELGEASIHMFRNESDEGLSALAEALDMGDYDPSDDMADVENIELEVYDESTDSYQDVPVTVSWNVEPTEYEGQYLFYQGSADVDRIDLVNPIRVNGKVYRQMDDELAALILQTYNTRETTLADYIADQYAGKIDIPQHKYPDSSRN